VFETTELARLEASPGVHVIQTVVAGRVASTRMALGKAVEAGDVLVELDAQNELSQLDEERAKLASLSGQLTALYSERDNSEHALREHQSELPVALREADLRRDESESSAAFAEGERHRIGRLHDVGAVNEAELERALAEARQRRAAADALGSAAERLRSSGPAQQSERIAAIARLDRESARVAGDIAVARANIRRLEHVVSERTILAPVSGRLAQVNDVQVGAVLEEGTRLGAVVPAGELRVVARFPASSALGRLQPGQKAWLRLEGFPWTEYGKTAATVATVGNEQVDDKIRVELTVAPATSWARLQHGLAGTVEVEVERIAPAALLARITMRRLTGVAPH
jgi:membrane fusion protein (multidrug efflux system)